MTDQGLFDEWWAVVFATLEARANDGPEPETEDIERAVLSLAAVTMVGIGMEPGEVTDRLADDDCEIYMAYDPESDQVLVTLDWDEGDEFTFRADTSDLA